jgi:capsular polysaccharide biosynthesis protein
MSLRDTLRILRQRGWIALLIAILTAAAAFGFSEMQTPVYKSTITLSISTRPDWGTSQAAKALLRNYAANMYSLPWAQQVIDRLQLDVTPEDLKSRVTIDPDETRFTLQIDVKDYSPELANRIAETWAQLTVEWRQQENQRLLEKRDWVNASIIEPPKATLYSPQTKINTLAGFILGTLVGALVVFGLEWIESGVVRTPEDMERFAGLTVLGAIPTVAVDGTGRATQRARTRPQ